MGSTKRDIHKNSRQWGYASLSDFEVVKGLITLRDVLDIYYGIGFLNISYAEEINEGLIIVYANLDILIEKCNFNELQKNILSLVYQGYNYEEINIKLKIKSSEKKLNQMCRKIVSLHKKNWLSWFYYNYKITDWKRCSKCREILPANNSFFSPDKRKPDGLQYICKECDKGRKKLPKNAF